MKAFNSETSSYESADLVRVGAEMYAAAVRAVTIAAGTVAVLTFLCMCLIVLCARYLDTYEFKRQSSILHVDLADRCGYTSRRSSAIARAHRRTSSRTASPSHDRVPPYHNDTYLDAPCATPVRAEDDNLSPSMPRDAETFENVVAPGADDQWNVRRVN